MADKKLTIGMAIYDDYDGVFFTSQALRMYNPEVWSRCEILLIDNHPDSIFGKEVKRLADRTKYRYVPFTDWTGTTVKEQVFKQADTDYVMCIDCHVLLPPGTLQYLLRYFDFCGNDLDLLHGPILGDDHQVIATHQDPVWRGGQLGIWANDERGKDINHSPFDIPLQGTGAIACTKLAWPGFNPKFRGFGGEEGYIHEKARQRGGRVMCLPGLRWMHRFDRPGGIPYACRNFDKFRNYMIGMSELGKDIDPVIEHFKDKVSQEEIDAVMVEINPPSPSRRGYVLV